MSAGLELNPSVSRLIETVSDAPSPEIVAIWGASGSGKSTLARFISQKIPKSNVFPIDRYLSPNLKTATFNHEPTHPIVPYVEGLDPAIWDQDLLNKHLALIATMQSIQMPIFDHYSRERTGYDDFTPSEVTIVEGSYAFENSIENAISRRVLVHAPFHDRFIRKLMRTSHISRREDLDESMSRYIKRTEPAAAFYYQKYLPIADISIDNPSDPRVEFADYTTGEVEGDSRNKHYFHPRDKSRPLHNGELLSIESLNSSEHIFRYSLDRQILLHAKIGSNVVRLLGKHYAPYSPS